jgi:hypothetical protein
MRFRKLPIAWSVACGIACVLLILLWVRSYWWFDTCDIASRVELSSFYGTIGFDVALPPWSFKRDWHYGCESAETWFGKSDPRLQLAKRNLVGFSWISDRPGHVPHWALVVTTFVLKVAPWILPRRFSLRTLLLATTLVAVVLGAIVYAIS